MDEETSLERHENSIAKTSQIVMDTTAGSEYVKPNDFAEYR